LDALWKAEHESASIVQRSERRAIPDRDWAGERGWPAGLLARHAQTISRRRASTAPPRRRALWWPRGALYVGKVA